MTIPVTSTRRAFIAGATALLPVLPIAAAPILALDAAEPVDRARAFAAALATLALPVTLARLELVSYDETECDAGIAFRAVVCLTWAPGMRTRLIEAEATDYASGLVALLAGVEARFCSPY